MFGVTPALLAAARAARSDFGGRSGELPAGIDADKIKAAITNAEAGCGIEVKAA
jgi:hypothetical protein